MPLPSRVRQRKPASPVEEKSIDSKDQSKPLEEIVFGKTSGGEGKCRETLYVKLAADLL